MWMNLAVAIVTLLVIALLSLPRRYVDKTRDKPSVQILVLGDLGRSPRMQYHALSFLKHGGEVQLIGYLESLLLEDLQGHPNLSIVPLPTTQALQTSHKLIFLFLGPLKVFLQVWYLWRTLGYQTRPSKWMLVQNPPSIPTLIIAGLVCYLRGTKLVIDWHNFGYSILALKLGDRHPLVRISYYYEFLCARLASAHLCVTDAMAKLLRTKLPPHPSIFTLHDRPASHFQPLSTHDRLAFLQRYTTLADHYTTLSTSQTKLLVSSTSWTPDEDFSLLLSALVQYSTSAALHPRMPELIVVITGKGPLKSRYLSQIADLRARDKLDQVHIYTDFVSFSDYASLLGAADLGISLHTSSSGVDLPMKVVDMFGAGLPVLGVRFEAWGELVREGVNGMGFGSAAELAGLMLRLFEPGDKELKKLKNGAVVESERRWEGEWDGVAGRLFGFVESD